MNAFYNSDEDIAWGKITPREIKRHVKSQIGKKPHKRHSAVNFSYNSKEIMESSGSSTNSKLNDITNKYNISGTSTQYFTANDTFKTGPRNNSCMELPTNHSQPEMMLDNFYATLVNNTVLSDDAGYDVSLDSRGNNISTPHTNKKESIICISDDDDDQNESYGKGSKQCNFDRLSKLKCERLMDYDADTSDYHENVTLESEDVSEGRINLTDCISLSSVDEDSDKSTSSEEEACSKIPRSLCGYNDSILDHENESIRHTACQSGNEMYYSKCDGNFEHCDSDNSTSAEVHEIVEHQDNNSEKNDQMSVILEEASSKIPENLCGYNDSISGHEKESIIHTACQSGSEMYYSKCDDYFENYDVPQNTQEDVNVTKHSSSQWRDLGIKLDKSVDSSTPERNMIGDIHYDRDAYKNVEKKSPNKYFDYSIAESEDVPQNTQECVNVTRHSSPQWSRDLGIKFDESVDSSTPERNMIGDIHYDRDAHKHFDKESPNNDSIAESEDFNLDNSNNSSNKEEFDNTLDRIEKLLNQHMEVANKSVTTKTKIISTSTSSVSTEGSRIPRPVKSPYVGDVFKVPQSIEKKKIFTPKSASKLNFKDVVSPVGLYIKYSPHPVIKGNVNAVESKIPPSPPVSVPNRRNFRGTCQDLPSAIYKPSRKQIITPAKKLFLPPSLEKMVHESEMVKHESRVNRPHNESDINRYLCEAELTRCSISDTVLDSSSQNISVLTTKHTLH